MLHIRTSFAIVSLLAVLCLSCKYDQPPTPVLVFSKTAGFRHASIADGVAALQHLGDTSTLRRAQKNLPPQHHQAPLRRTKLRSQPVAVHACR